MAEGEYQMVGTLFSKYRMLLLLSSAWMIGTGLRFIMMRHDEVYTYSLFDKFFDWGILFGLGVLLFMVTILRYLRETKQ